MKTKICILLAVLCFACDAQKDTVNESDQARTALEFESRKWKIKSDKDYPYRDRMLKDLINNHHLRGVNKDSVIDVLGEPDRSDGAYLFYQVAQKRIKFFPLHTRTLVIKLAPDSTVSKMLIHE